MTLGNILSNQEENVRYAAKFDSITKTWRILDQWSDAIRTLTADDDIADDNPAVTILSDGQFTALLKEASMQGEIPNPSYQDIDIQQFQDELDSAYEKIESLTEKLEKSNKEVINIQSKPERSEKYDLNVQAMDSILKLASMQYLAEQSKE